MSDERARDRFAPLSALGQHLLPDRAEDDPVGDRERRSAEVVRLLPGGHPMRVRVTPPPEVADAPEPKPPSLPSGRDEH